MDKFKIALVQMKSILNKEKNLTKINNFVNKAANKGAKIICFPEMSVCGYDRNFSKNLAEKIPGYISLKLLEMVRNKNIVIIAGMLEMQDSNRYITQITVFPDGKVEKYRKTHLGKNERNFCLAGDELPIFKMKCSKNTNKEVKFGIGICYDLHFPEVVSIMSLQGAQIIFAPFASPLSGEKRFNVWEKYMGARAYDNRVYVAACNFKGMGIWDPFGNLAKSYKKDDENIILLDLDLENLNDIREGKSGYMKNQFFLKDRRAELYRKYI